MWDGNTSGQQLILVHDMLLRREREPDGGFPRLFAIIVLVSI